MIEFVHRIYAMTQQVDFAFTLDHLNTLESIANLMDAVPDPTPSMRAQLAVIRPFVARSRGAFRLGMNVQVLNTEVVKIEAASRFAYSLMTGAPSNHTAKYNEYGLTVSNTTDLWIAVSELIRLFKKHGPYGYEGVN